MHIKEIIHELRTAEDEIERMQAAERLSSHANEDAVLALIDAMGDENELVQGAAMESLKQLSLDPSPFLRAAVSDPRFLVRWGAVEMLVNYPSLETEVALCEGLTDEEPSIRGAAARSLRLMVKRGETITQLRALLSDSDSFPRYQAILTLQASASEFVDEDAIIWEDLYSDEPLDRVAALHFIRENQRREWEHEIGRFRTDSDSRVRRAAEWAWERLTVSPD